jgi:hypothetical protein
MANFLLLYTGGGNMPQTEAEQAAIIKAWTDWFTGLGDAIVDPGNPFTPAAKHIASSGRVSKRAVRGMATGYSIIRADSLDAAVEKAKGCPQLTSEGQITVYETFAVM